MWTELWLQLDSGGTVNKNPPANSGDTGSIPDPGIFHMGSLPQLIRLCSRACEPQILSLHATTTKPAYSRAHEPQLTTSCSTATEACVPRGCTLQQEKLQPLEICTPQQRVASIHWNKRKPVCINKHPLQQQQENIMTLITIQSSEAFA